MDFFNIGDKINVKDLNAIIYLLRKFKRLNTGLRLGSLSLESDYGSFVFDRPLTSVGGNFIIEEEIHISSSDCLRNCFYSFVFNVIDVNTSGTVNKRTVKVTGGTGETGELYLTIPTDLIESDEVILPVFEVDIVFDEHEYYTPVVGNVNVDLVSDVNYVLESETATITATLTDEDGEALVGVPCNFFINGEVFTETTDSEGQAETTYTGTGTYAKITVTVITTSITLYDTPLTAVITGDSIVLGNSYSYNSWLESIGDVLIDWGDGSTSTVNKPTTALSHSYTDGETSHTIVFVGDVTSLGEYCFMSCTGLTSVSIPSSVTSIRRGCFGFCVNLTSVTIPDSVISLGSTCFMYCTGLTSVSIPSGITSIGNSCFYGCSSLIDYQLYWKEFQIIHYDVDNMPNNSNTVFTIPYRQTDNYIIQGYPSSKLAERTSGKIETNINITADKVVIYTGESVTISGVLKDDEDNLLENKTVTLEIDTQDIWTTTTDSNGEYTQVIRAYTLETGSHIIIAHFDGDTDYDPCSSSAITVTKVDDVYDLSISVDKQSILTTESVTVSGVYSKNGTGQGGQTITIYDGATSLGTCTTGVGGAYSKTISGLSAGTHIIKASHTNVESSTVSITVTEPVPVPDIITITGTSVIQTGDTDTITATLLDGSTPVSGETLSYEIKHGSTTIDSGSDTTDSNGQVTISYTGTGVGDVDVIVSYSSLLQETYELEDCIRYNTLTSNDGIWSSSTAVIIYSSSGMYISNGNWSPFYLLDELSQDFSIEFDIVSVTTTAGTGLYMSLSYDTDHTHNYGQTTLDTTGHYKLVIENGVLTVYRENTQIDTHNWAYSSYYWFLWTGGTRKVTIKDLKVKAL